MPINLSNGMDHPTKELIQRSYLLLFALSLSGSWRHTPTEGIGVFHALCVAEARLFCGYKGVFNNWPIT